MKTGIFIAGIEKQTFYSVLDDYNEGVVLTSRPLRENELFEVRLDKIVTKWIGSIEIGVTTHSPIELAFPCMTNSRSDTWIMTGHGVMNNGIAFMYHYGQNLDKLKVGDRVGVMKNESSILHFYINGEDQGDVTTLAEGVYGLINLYGRAVQATIVHGNLKKDLKFHYLHGKSARITNHGLTATRRRSLEMLNDSVKEENNSGKEGVFSISIDKINSEQKDTMIQKYLKPGDKSTQQSTSEIGTSMRTYIIRQNIESLLNSFSQSAKFPDLVATLFSTSRHTITSFPNFSDMKSLKELVTLPVESKNLFIYDDFWDPKFYNHGRNIDRIKKNSTRFNCYKIKMKLQKDNKKVFKKNFEQPRNKKTSLTECKPQIANDLDIDDSCLINCICFIHECCQCIIL